MNHEDFKHETPIIIAKRTGKKQLINLLIKHGAKSVDDLHKSTKVKKGVPITTELVKDLPPSLLKKNSTNDTLKTD